MRIAIVGTRIPDKVWDRERGWSRNPVYRRVADEVWALVSSLPPDAVIVSGGCPVGVDRMARNAARESGRPLVEHLADWKRYGRSAGFRRNPTVVADVDKVHAWWDGKSRGTKHTIDIATKAGKPVEVHPI